MKNTKREICGVASWHGDQGGVAFTNALSQVEGRYTMLTQGQISQFPSGIMSSYECFT